MNRKGRPALLSQKKASKRRLGQSCGSSGASPCPSDCGGHPPLPMRGKPSPAPPPPPDCPAAASHCLAHAARTPPCYCILTGCLHPLAAPRWEKDLCFHCTNPCLHLTNHTRTWERRCITGQHVQHGGSHGLKLAVMRGRSLITFHFCGSRTSGTRRQRKDWTVLVHLQEAL